MAAAKDPSQKFTAFLKRCSPRQSDYPREILVGDAMYRIRFVRKIKEGTIRQGSDLEVVGLCDPSEKEILIIQGLDPLERFKAFIHELLHAIEFEHDIDIAHKLIYQLEEPIAAILIENLWAKDHGRHSRSNHRRKNDATT
jgi:hypothetical protein